MNSSKYEHKSFVEIVETLQIPQTQLFIKDFCLINKITNEVTSEYTTGSQELEEFWTGHELRNPKKDLHREFFQK